MKAGTKVKITKVGVVAGSKYRTASKEEYDPGMDNGLVSPPVDYEVRGTLAGDVVLGQPILVERTHRNGLPVRGGMVTSRVTCVSFKDNGVVVTTGNSQYLLVEE